MNSAANSHCANNIVSSFTHFDMSQLPSLSFASFPSYSSLCLLAQMTFDSTIYPRAYHHLVSAGMINPTFPIIHVTGTSPSSRFPSIPYVSHLLSPYLVSRPITTRIDISPQHPLNPLSLPRHQWKRLCELKDR